MSIINFGRVKWSIQGMGDSFPNCDGPHDSDSDSDF